jgi:cytochrome c-type biogenesis protein CcmH/NrfG
MKNFERLSGVLLLVVLANIFVFAQDDEARRATGLPTKIGENSTDETKGNLSGKIKVEGVSNPQKKPVIFVSVYYNGVLVDKRQAKDDGNYFISGVPRLNSVLVVEIDGDEVGRYPLPPSTLGNIRQDITINLGEKQNSDKPGVVSAKDLYSRSEENEKLFAKAMSAAKDKKLDDAIKLFKQIVDGDAKDFVAWTELGTLYFRNEKFSDAEKSYQKALELKPDFMAALVNLGRVHLAQKHPDKAVTVLTKAIEVDPKSADAQHLLGEAYLGIKKGSIAVNHLYEALRLAPIEKAEVHLRLAWLYNAVGLKDKAVEEYKQFLQKVPNYAEKGQLEKYIKENSPQ